jgi:hypothetical protein
MANTVIPSPTGHPRIYLNPTYYSPRPGPLIGEYSAGLSAVRPFVNHLQPPTEERSVGSTSTSWQGCQSAGIPSQVLSQLSCSHATHPLFDPSSRTLTHETSGKVSN